MSHELALWPGSFEERTHGPIASPTNTIPWTVENIVDREPWRVQSEI